MADDITIRARYDLTAAKALMDKLSGPKMFQALSVAVNDSARQVERKAESLVAKSLSQPLKRTRLGIYIRPFSTPKTLTATIKGSSSMIPLKAFNAREDGDGVTAKIWGTNQHHPGAFIFGGSHDKHKTPLGMGGHVMNRVGPSRMPIEKSQGGTIAESMAKAAVSTANEQYALERLEVNVMRQLDRYTRSHSNVSKNRNGEGKYK